MSHGPFIEHLEAEFERSLETYTGRVGERGGQTWVIRFQEDPRSQIPPDNSFALVPFPFTAIPTVSLR